MTDTASQFDEGDAQRDAGAKNAAGAVGASDDAGAADAGADTLDPIIEVPDGSAGPRSADDGTPRGEGEPTTEQTTDVDDPAGTLPPPGD